MNKYEIIVTKRFVRLQFKVIAIRGITPQQIRFEMMDSHY